MQRRVTLFGSEDPRDGVTPLLETIVKQIDGPEIIEDSPFKMLVSNIDWDDYVGRVAIGKVLQEL